MKPAKSTITVLKQVVELIPGYEVSKLAREHGVDKRSRSFTPWSHVVALVHSQLAHSLSLNDLCDDLRNHSGALSTLRRAVPPSRNGLSHANRNRNADMAEGLFWSTLRHLQNQAPSFGMGRRYVGFPKRFRRVINVMDSTTIKLVANCMDWAKHRRRKAAAKCHMRLDLQTFLPRFALVKPANTHDATEAPELCADIRAGEVAVFDKAYINLAHLHSLDQRGVFWVTRSRDNMACEIVGQHTAPGGRILLDAVVHLTGVKSRCAYPNAFRLIVAELDVDGKPTVMSFITNNFEWAPSSICALYKGRWGVEVFFKQIKQTLQLADFLGHSQEAIRWQIWTALLTYVLLRFIAFRAQWKRSFARLLTVLRSVLWNRLDMHSVLRCCGTAPDPPPLRTSPGQAYLPGFAP